MNDPDSVPHSVLLSALPGNIYLHKLDQEIGRIDDQAVEETSFNSPQDNKAIFLRWSRASNAKRPLISLFRRGQESKKTPSGRVPYEPTLFLCAAVPKAEFYGIERKNSAMRDRKISRRGLLIDLGGEERPVIRSERRPTRSTSIAARSTVEFPGTVIREVPHSKQVIPIQFLREQEKRLQVKHRIYITAYHLRSTIHSQFRNLGKSLPIKELTRGMNERRSLLDAVQLAETLGTAGVRSPQVSVLWGIIKHIRQEPREIFFLHNSDPRKVPSDAVSRSGMSVTIQKLSLYTRKAAGEKREYWAGSFSSEFPIQIEAPIKKILRRLRDRGLIS
ncbi:hypothetical protein C5167_009784 [Papaver somniferum]|uniref:Uncharacterized protein n=1 Tax=Papaver somniferum TaxID=3469 RepID=A0A4Y7K2A9_PAPSO|nr:hypothetical protein C5167_009784 [Papaver somniferum]